MNIAILDDYQDYVKKLDCFSLLDGHKVVVLNHTEKNISTLASFLRDIDIIVPIRERTRINSELLALLPKLKLISQTGKISNHLDLESCTKHRVLVAEGIGSPIAPAELTWALIMNSLRKLSIEIEALKRGKWQTTVGDTVFGKKFGIWGYGKIGKRIAQYARVFGAEVFVWGSEKSMKQSESDGFAQVKTKESFFEEMDIITLHLRLLPSTTGIVKGTDLLRMKDTALLVNTARAELIEKDALLNSLKQGKPGFAALDVFDNEPLEYSSPLLSLPNVFCTPHLGYVEKNSYEMYFKAAFENIVNFVNGKPTNIANPELLSKSGITSNDVIITKGFY